MYGDAFDSHETDSGACKGRRRRSANQSLGYWLPPALVVLAAHAHCSAAAITCRQCDGSGIIQQSSGKHAATDGMADRGLEQGRQPQRHLLGDSEAVGTVWQQVGSTCFVEVRL